MQGAGVCRSQPCLLVDLLRVSMVLSCGWSFVGRMMKGNGLGNGLPPPSPPPMASAAETSRREASRRFLFFRLWPCSLDFSLHHFPSLFLSTSFRWLLNAWSRLTCRSFVQSMGGFSIILLANVLPLSVVKEPTEQRGGSTASLSVSFVQGANHNAQQNIFSGFESIVHTRTRARTHTHVQEGKRE